MKRAIGLSAILLALVFQSHAVRTVLTARPFVSRAYVNIAQNDSVDLRGKDGVVDPADLKKYDPPERGLHTTEPPSPPTERPSGGPPTSPPNGSLQGPNAHEPLRYAPIRPSGTVVR